MRRHRWNCLALGLGALIATSATAEQATVAVAANFASPMEKLVSDFERTTAHDVTTVLGSTGQLYAQILNGAPYDVFLAADHQRPALLGRRGPAESGTQFTYALGQLVLWTAEPRLVSDFSLDALTMDDYRHLAIANPLLAPYGLAAMEVLEHLGLWESHQPRIVRGENIGQAFSMVSTRNAELGLIALSLAMTYVGPATYATIPPEYYEPIRQDAILLSHGRENAAAVAFLDFLNEASARRIILASGYRLPAD